MNIIYCPGVPENHAVRSKVEEFLNAVDTMERSTGSPVVIFQDGKSSSYYLRCCIDASVATPLLDLNARLIPNSPDSLRANRELLLNHVTFKRMRDDAEGGREFSDIIVEYSTEYGPEKPLKVWGGQHRSKAIQDAFQERGASMYHGFRVYFNLSKEQRTEVALISNTNIDISNDLFDRQLEETLVGPQLRKWCQAVGLLGADEDFPSQGSRAERITTKLARSFIVNFFLGQARGAEIGENSLDSNIYEPYLCESGAGYLDTQYAALVLKPDLDVWPDAALQEAGKSFANWHKAQYKAVSEGGQIKNLKGFRMKAMTPSVITACSYVAGLLQAHPARLKVHLKVPGPSKGAPDPLNAVEMSKFKHDVDPPTYRGLGTRTVVKDRQRMAQVFLARSKDPNSTLEKSLLNQAVSQVVGLKALQKGYMT